MRALYICCLLLFAGSYCWAQPTKSFFVVHADPLEPNGVIFSDLAELVDTANFFGVKLTIEFSKPWCDTIISSAAYMNQVRQWQLEGHEMAVHHHDYEHPAWDGYSNTATHPVHPSLISYAGDMTEVYSVTDSICGDSLCLTVGSGPDSLESVTDYYDRWIYKTDGGLIDTNAFSYITQDVFGPYEVCGIRYTFLETSADLLGIQALFDTVNKPFCGVVTHVWNWAADKPLFVSWFNYITSQTPGECKTVRQLMREEGCTSSTLELESIKQNQHSIFAYPNPASNKLWIDIPPKLINKDYTVTLFNLLGEKVLTVKNSNEIQVNRIVSGIYLVELKTDQAKYLTKVLIQ